MQTAQIFWFLQVDDINLHGKDNQQAVEILKQTGPVVRLKVARHVNRKYSRSYTAGSVSSQASSGVLEALPATVQEKSTARKPRKGKLIPMYCITSTDACISVQLVQQEEIIHVKKLEAPNDGMCSDLSEVSQMVSSLLQRPVWLIWSYPKSYYLSVCMSEQDVYHPKSFTKVAFLFHPKLLLVATLVFKFKRFRTQSSHTLNRQFQGTYCLYNKNFGRPFCKINNCNIVVVECKKLNLHQLQERQQKMSEYLRQNNGTVILKFLAFTKLQKFLGNIKF